MLMHQLRQLHEQRHGQTPAVMASAPGRLEVLGNHTDYNEGVVLSCAIDRVTRVAAHALDGDLCRVFSQTTGEERSFSVADPGQPVPGDWANYVKGVVVELAKRGVKVPAFAATITSEVPLSAGMSSSAALEMAVGLVLCRLAGVTLAPAELARVGQGAENHFVGARTGLLDQFTSLNGQADHLVHIDFRTLEVAAVPCPPGLALVVANSGVKHNLTREYNDRRESCERAAAALARRHPGVRTLRDVSLEQLHAARAALDYLDYRRALHVVGECTRVGLGLAALRAGDGPALGALLSESHASSRDNFENSCPELDALVALGQTLPGGYGGRLSGGGFGGICIHLVHAAAAEDFRRRLASAWQLRSGRELETMTCAIGEGAALHV